MNKPKVSVIMSVYNDEKYLSEAIESILNQTYKDFEFIIINDGSNDDSLNIIKHFTKQDNRIILIDQENIGLTKSLNRAIKLAKGSYIARMDSDDISDKARFERQITFLESNQEYALVGTNIAKIDKDDNLLEINRTKYSDKDIKKTFYSRNCIAHGSVMLNKNLLKGMLHYDENFKYAQDFKLWTQIAKYHKVANLKEPLYRLRIHKKSISKKKIEEQSIYAGVVAYEFENNKNITNIDVEVAKNLSLRRKIGTILLMNFKPELAKHYFSKRDIYFWLCYLSSIVDLKKIKKIVKIVK